MSILSVPISDPKVPKILDFGEILDNKEVVLVRLGDSISSLASSCQVCELRDHIIHLLDACLMFTIPLPRLRLGQGRYFGFLL